MKISGFTMVRNADKYYFPIKEAILSILPIVDEFVVALGNNDADDKTLDIINSIASDKIKIFHRTWSEQEFVDGKIFANETSFALSQCTGDWCFYLQADEVIHEKDLETIATACQSNLNKKEVDGLLFKYYHFYGDYDHYLPIHGWYKNEIRIVRNNAHIYSYKDAQSFRKQDNQKLNVVEIDAHIYHYGWVRPPRLMQSKKKEQDSMHHGKDRISAEYISKPIEFDYGALGKLPLFPHTHPQVMSNFIQQLDWTSQLNYTTSAQLDRPLLKHEKWQNRLLTFFENLLNGGKDFFGYSNWNKIG